MSITRRSVLAAGVSALPLYAISASASAASQGGAEPIVETTHGAVRGVRDGGLAIFRGIPFAAPPVGRLRFKAPEPAAKWRGVRDATQFGPMAPQRPSRLSRIMGDYDHPQAEDNCLTLNVWTPALSGPPAPVLVWIHGGGGVTGSGRLDWYSGLTFARNGGIVAVTINYRLGPFGLMYLPGVADGNMTALDQRAAMRWIKDNIARFGGDPQNITVSGQSGGGRAVATLMGSKENDGLFRRAILQSPAVGSFLLTQDEAARRAHEYVQLLKLDKPADILKAPAEQLLTAYAELGRRGKRFANLGLPFNPVVDGRVYSGDPVDAFVAGTGGRTNIDVLIGTTRDESAAHYAFDNDVLNGTEAQLRQRFTEIFGAEADAYLDEFRRMRPRGNAYDLLVQLGAEAGYLRKSIAIAEAQAKRGQAVYFWRFDWQSPVKNFGAAHCLELPFVFNNLESWRSAPMLAGADPAQVQALAKVMHQAWINFVKTGNPSHAGIPPWARYDVENRTTMRFDTMVEPVGDLAGLRWRRPWIRGV